MMNERIKELKHQASLWCDKNIPEQYSEETNGYGRAWEDKFAELIVRECSQIATYPQLGDEESYYGNEFAKAIKKHFGVE